ncbi:type II toxin-antitoxin system toxin DNA ADP-ribosyl transferase DarT [Streptosporangium jomthongense]|uniref:DUF4433 domain-containing protein n=1 Tax=Streptosporangium jomthongense TaxID=1193683 RepID=A0ABV8EWL6_9ACTN
MYHDRRIYHFTHVKNLPRILKEGALLSDSLVQAGQKLTVEVGDLHVKKQRRSMKVTLPPGGCPADYVPFYFAPRSPMLYVINKGGVEQYREGQEPLIYLVSSVDRIVSEQLDWVFTDGNCASGITEYFNDLENLKQAVDWPLMGSMIWKNTAEDPDRMRRRMAEFLVHRQVPRNCLLGIATKTKEIEKEVKEIFQKRNESIYVDTRSNWYY